MTRIRDTLSSLDHPPSEVSLLVDFYDEHEKAAFLGGPMSSQLEHLPTKVRVQTSALLTYYLYYKRKNGAFGYSTHEEVSYKLPLALSELDGQAVFADDTIRLMPKVKFDTGTAERIGEAIGLSVASHLHDLHQADWLAIPETNSHKTFDYTTTLTSSTGDTFVQVETKGSTVDRNDLKHSTVSKHKKSIKDKKTQKRERGTAAAIMYGTIGVLDDRESYPAQCWLVDPPPTVDGDPLRFKIIARLQFIANLIWLISPRSTLSTALQTRLAALKELRNIHPLDKVSLVKGNGEPVQEGVPSFGERSLLFGSRSRVKNTYGEYIPVGGDAFILDESHLLFVGFHERLARMAAAQDFGEISSYVLTSGVFDRTIECKVPTSRYKSEFRQVV
ncbi:hypothetical protein [Maioricimonas sp. JC845]|uniref:hypothetical protein n=1 Tax=Maioricimonas sp. JC845 TaxID=3232138 RepID=UPI003459797E